MKFRLLALLLVGAMNLTMFSGQPVLTPGEPEITPAVRTAAPAEAERLTAEEAKAIALAHAGLTADQVKGLKAEYDVEDGVPEYEIEFRHDGWEYDYEIHAGTGEIHRTEKEPVKQTAAPVVSTEPAATEPKALTAEEAKAIALAHAGLTADQVRGLKAEYDVDDGVPEYEIEFRHDGWEYDYEIHAETGEIRRTEKEPVKQTAAPAVSTEPKALTAEEAKAIALAHAGLTADQVRGLKAEYDVDDSVPEYEIEFRYDGWEYDYEIHAENGKVLSWDKEWDD